MNITSPADIIDINVENNAEVAKTFDLLNDVSDRDFIREVFLK
jgi:hypothetical protein